MRSNTDVKIEWKSIGTASLNPPKNSSSSCYSIDQSWKVATVSCSCLRSYFENVSINWEGKNKIGYSRTFPWKFTRKIKFVRYPWHGLFFEQKYFSPPSCAKIFDKITVKRNLQGGIYIYIYIFEIKIYLICLNSLLVGRKSCERKINFFAVCERSFKHICSSKFEIKIGREGFL